MFARYRGNEMVKAGTYLSITTGEFVNVADTGAQLPGSEQSRYLAVNPLVALLVGPIAGLLFVIFLPLAVPVFVAWQLASRARLKAQHVLRQAAYSATPQGLHAAAGANGGLLPRRTGGDQQDVPSKALDAFLSDIEKRLEEPEQER